MPVSAQHIEQVKRFAGDRIVITCEHASNAVPKGLRPGLGIGGAVLRTHVAWDPGAREVASILADRLGAAQFMGRYTRLLVDLNRSRGSRQLIPKESFGIEIPGNKKLTRKQRDERIEKFWEPYRDVVERAVARAIERAGSCLHLSVHSFTPELDGEVRDAEMGLLYDPRRAPERRFAERVAAALEEQHAAVRMNYPYKGTADGFTAYLRKTHPAARYIGVEIELNQNTVETNRQRWRVGRLLTEAIAAAIDV